MPAKSPAQQRLFGAALNAKRTGNAAFPLAGKLASEMTDPQLSDFAQKAPPKGRAPKQLKTATNRGINPRKTSSYL